MDAEHLAQALAALGSGPRLRIISALVEEPTHVSELARRLGMSRPLLYTHLNRLEEAGLVLSRLDPAGEGRVKKHYWVADFAFEVNPGSVHRVVTDTKENN